MPSSCIDEKWLCPICNEENSKFISVSTILPCDHCRKSLSWDGEKVVTYEEWLERIRLSSKVRG